ncbi:hypothetical protein [Staphylococcus sp. GDK8D30P]|nr:hypothetical protein [Staphylococcus sp. GDK8D30P]
MEEEKEVKFDINKIKKEYEQFIKPLIANSSNKDLEKKLKVEEFEKDND